MRVAVTVRDRDTIRRMRPDALVARSIAENRT